MSIDFFMLMVSENPPVDLWR